MIVVAVLALTLARGAPPALVAIVAVAVWRPWWFLVGISGWVVLHRIRTKQGPGPGDEADFLRGLAAELSGGASLRSAVVAAADRAPRLGLDRVVRLAQAGRPADQVGAALGGSLPYNGQVAATAFALAATTGGEAGGIMSTLAARADEVGNLARERRALTAQARLSAWMVGGAPVAFLALLGATGRLDGLVGDPAGRAVLVVGLALQIAGVACVAWMLRRSDR